MGLNGSSSQLIVLKQLVTHVLTSTHDGASGSYLRVIKKLGKIRESFYWLNYKEVESWCRYFRQCFVSKGPATRRKAKIQNYNVSYPFERIALDICGPFQKLNAETYMFS